MANFQRNQLPELVNEITLAFNYLLWQGGHTQLQSAYIGEIRFSLPMLAALEIGISPALDKLCYQLDELAETYWPYDSREQQIRAIIDEIQDFQIAMMRARR